MTWLEASVALSQATVLLPNSTLEGQNNSQRVSQHNSLIIQASAQCTRLTPDQAVVDSFIPVIDARPSKQSRNALFDTWSSELVLEQTSC